MDRTVDDRLAAVHVAVRRHRLARRYVLVLLLLMMMLLLLRARGELLVGRRKLVPVWGQALAATSAVVHPTIYHGCGQREREDLMLVSVVG